jgi:hypothetical protein
LRWQLKLLLPSSWTNQRDQQVADPFCAIIVDPNGFVGLHCWMLCGRTWECKTGIVDEHIQSAMVLAQIFGKMFAALFISDVQLMEFDIAGVQTFNSLFTKCWITS